MMVAANAAVMLAALTLECAVGWPDALDRRIGHPVRWFGWIVMLVEPVANAPGPPRAVRIAAGGVCAVVLILLAGAVGAAVARIVPAGVAGFAMSAVIAASLLAPRSLHDHAAAVGTAWREGGLDPARVALSHIVGRNTKTLDEAGIARAAIESLAENTSDGVTAPLFWGALFGLPGLFAYKTINTLDSMIGHRSMRYEAFGKIAARIDDMANLIPARLTGAIFAFCAGSGRAFATMRRDASRHRSPNAGWPESAMAGALNIRLSGPREYDGAMRDEPWLNAGARDPAVGDIWRALALYRRAVGAMAGILGIIAGAAIV
ncbi:adenosylcobinamide-phosphate synthase CbiB [Croceicoccus hydrothermalis]|uniref:adenosylcobinamide-phosphate synthase CbiB n=1 Tax=Croceicoccus hydrothermalis TaxID=2867964 RepID=UPI001EFB014D|nr:adenosylcobinamide-phosphate synthase CbiB [Croceicoccus hydrothermalis]